MRVFAVEEVEVQVDLRVGNEGAEKLARQIRVEASHLRPRQGDAVVQVGSAAQVDDGSCQGIIERRVGVRETADLEIRAQSFTQRCSQHDADVFNQVVLVDV